LPKFREHAMNTIIKRFVIQMYCRDLVTSFTVVRVFARLNLKKA
jgi:hypothetical protein